jgi:hypothetical protein
MTMFPSLSPTLTLTLTQAVIVTEQSDMKAKAADHFLFSLVCVGLLVTEFFHQPIDIM